MVVEFMFDIVVSMDVSLSLNNSSTPVNTSVDDNKFTDEIVSCFWDSDVSIDDNELYMSLSLFCKDVNELLILSIFDDRLLRLFCNDDEISTHDNELSPKSTFEISNLLLEFILSCLSFCKFVIDVFMDWISLIFVLIML